MHGRDPETLRRLNFIRSLPLLMIWTNSYERLTWTTLLVLIALEVNSPEALAYAASAYSAANLAGNIAFGSMSDRLGRFRVAGFALLALAVTTLIHLRVTSALFLVLLRAFHGFFAAAVTPSSLAAASDHAAPESRGQSMARVGLMIAIASILAPPLTGRLIDGAGLASTIWIQTAYLALVGAVAVLARPQAAQPAAAAETDAPAPQTGETGRFAGSGIDPRIALFACLIGFTVMFGQNVLFYALPLKAHEAGLKPSAIGSLFGVFAVGAAIAFMPPLSRLADRYGRLRPIILGSAISAAGMTILSRGVTLGSMKWMSVGLFIYGLGFGLSFPAVTAAAADGAESRRRGLAFGLLTASFSVGAIVGPLVAQGMEHVLSPFVVGAIVMLAGLSSVPLTRHSPALQRALTRA